MNLLGAFLIVPLGLASLLTGLIQSLGTHWGLLRHHWVVTKLLLTIGAVTLLMLHQFTAVAGAARMTMATAAGARPHVGRFGTQLVVDAALAVVVLLTNTTLSVFKPWGRTRNDGSSLVYAIPLALLLMLVVILHLTGVVGAH